MGRFSTHLENIFFSDGGMRWWWQIVLYTLLLVIGVPVLVGPVAWFLFEIELLPTPGHPIGDWTSALSIAFIEVILFASVLWLTHFAQRRLRASTLAGLGLRFDRHWAIELGVGLGLGIFAVSLVAGLAWGLGWYRPLGFFWQLRPLAELGPVLVFSFFVNLQPGLLEEVIFRGYLLQTLETRWGRWAAVLTSSILFGILHMTSAPWWGAVLNATLIGLLLAQMYLMRRSLWLPISFHFAWNWSSGVLGVDGRSGDSAILLISEAVESPLSHELAVAGVVVVALILWLWSWRSRYHRATEETNIAPLQGES